LISTEIDPEKAARARAQLAALGLSDWAEVRVGDAFVTLNDLPEGSLDMLFLDGPKAAYRPLLEQLEPALARGSLVVSDNVDMAGASSFLAYVSEAGRGYLRVSLATEALGRHHGNELLLRT